MKKQFEAKKLEITEDRPGLSIKMLKNHFTLYEGYVKKTNEIEEKLETADRSKANGVYSEFGELKRQETFAVNGMKLHELYFDHLTDPQPPVGDIVEMIEQEFGTLDYWKADFIATGLSARGWAILSFDIAEKRLHNYGADAHNVGAVWGAIPLIALDVYEHAYFIDYGVSRKEYIDAFFTNLNWQHANKLIERYHLKQA